MRKLFSAISFVALIAASPAFAARCGGDFNTFVAAMSAEAQAAGISPAVISQALSGVTQDPAVLNFDRRQRGTFNKTFEQYVSTRVGAGRINMGRQMLRGTPRCWRGSSSSSGCRGRSWWRSGGWRAISARATSARCR